MGDVDLAVDDVWPTADPSADLEGAPLPASPLLGAALFPADDESGSADKDLVLSLPDDFWGGGNQTGDGHHADGEPVAAGHAFPPLAVVQPPAPDQETGGEQADDLDPQLVLPPEIWNGGRSEGAPGPIETPSPVEEWAPTGREEVAEQQQSDDSPFDLTTLFDPPPTGPDESGAAAPIAEPMWLAPAPGQGNRRDRRRRIGGRAAVAATAAAIVLALILGRGPDSGAPRQVDAAVPQTTQPTRIPGTSVPRVPTTLVAAAADSPAAPEPAPAPNPTPQPNDTGGAPAPDPRPGVPTTARATPRPVAPLNPAPTASVAPVTREPAPAADPPPATPAAEPSNRAVDNRSASTEPTADNSRRNRPTDETTETTVTTVTSVTTVTTAPTSRTTLPGRACLAGEPLRPVPCD